MNFDQPLCFGINWVIHIRILQQTLMVCHWFKQFTILKWRIRTNKSEIVSSLASFIILNFWFNWLQAKEGTFSWKVRHEIGKNEVEKWFNIILEWKIQFAVIYKGYKFFNRESEPDKTPDLVKKCQAFKIPKTNNLCLKGILLIGLITNKYK